MDVFSDILRVVRLNGGCFFSAHFTAPWAVHSPPADELAQLMATRAESVALFHILVEGQCWFSLKGRQPVLLKAGSVVIFPHSNTHNMSSNPKLTPEPIVPLLSFSGGKSIPEINHGGKGEQTRLICGYLQCDQAFNPLIGTLPSMLLVTPGENEKQERSPVNAAGRTPRVVIPDSGDWLGLTLKHLVDEVVEDRPGCSTMLGRLVELFYVEVLRRYLQQLPAQKGGWLAGLKDPEVGRALRMMHAQPARKWTVKELAHEIGLSRSVLAQRFTGLVGEPPMQYLTNWRMQLAKNFMAQPRLSIPQIAAQTGYGSTEAFNRAFKRYCGKPPAAWRKDIAGL